MRIVAKLLANSEQCEHKPEQHCEPNNAGFRCRRQNLIVSDSSSRFPFVASVKELVVAGSYAQQGMRREQLQGGCVVVNPLEAIHFIGIVEVRSEANHTGKYDDYRDDDGNK